MTLLAFLGVVGLAVPRNVVVTDMRESWHRLPGHEHDGNPEMVSKWFRDALWHTVCNENTVPPNTEVTLGKIVDGDLLPDTAITTTHDSRTPTTHVQQ